MHVPTHILSGWCAASLLRLTPGERLGAMIAASAADIDGISIVFGEGAFQNYHHLLGHNLLWAIVVSVVLTTFATHRVKAFVLYLLLAHVHLVMDYFGSGPFWPIYYLWPFNGSFSFINKHAWPFSSWQNTTVAAVLLAWTILIAYRHGRTPIELIAPRLDQAFVAWLTRGRAVKASEPLEANP
jgi:inner membrane protein